MAEYVHEPIKVGAGGDSGPVGGAKINKALEHILSRLTDLPAGAADFSSPDFAKFGLFSYASLWAEVNKTNLYRNAATPVIDFHGLQTGKAALIAFGDKQNFTNGPNGIASGITGLVTISGNATDGGLTLFINSGPPSATGFWSKRVLGGTWGEWTYYSPDIWTDVTTAMSPFQASPGYRVRIGDGATLRLMNSGNSALVGVRVAPKTTWDKVPAITTTQSGWTVQDHPTAGSAEVVYLPDPIFKVWEMKGGSGAQASTANPNAVQQQPAAPIPSVSQPVWQITNANVGNLITYTGVREINSVTFNYTDPEDDTSTAVFSLSDLVTGFSASGYYGGQARFIDVTMPTGKVVKVILVKNSATSLSIVVAKPGANLSVFGKIANVWITVVDAPLPVVPVTRVGRSIPTASGIDVVQQGTELTLGGLMFRVGGASLATAKVQVRSSGAASSLTYHGWTARHGPPAGYNTQSQSGMTINDSAGAYVDIGSNPLGVTDSARWDVWTDTEAFMVRAYQRNGVIHLGVNKIN